MVGDGELPNNLSVSRIIDNVIISDIPTKIPFLLLTPKKLLIMCSFFYLTLNSFVVEEIWSCQEFFINFDVQTFRALLIVSGTPSKVITGRGPMKDFGDRTSSIDFL